MKIENEISKVEKLKSENQKKIHVKKYSKLARRRTREGREIEEQKKKKAYVTRKVRRQEGQRARMPVDQKASLLEDKLWQKIDGKKTRWLDGQKDRIVASQKARGQ